MGFGLLLLIPVLAFGWISHRYLGSRQALIFVVFIAMTAVGLYAYLGNYTQARIWQRDYIDSYRLRQQFVQLGSTDGAIHALQQYLQNHPEDLQAQRLLKKLYQLHQNHQQKIQDSPS